MRNRGVVLVIEKWRVMDKKWRVMESINNHQPATLLSQTYNRQAAGTHQ
jgi:hypothetical protein